MTLTAKAYAKINLALHILHKRKDGYHELQSIMQSVSLYDTLTFVPASSGITLTCSEAAIPCDGKNTVHKAADILQKTYNVKEGVAITLDKAIPFGAGLAGGSADAAATLLALNTLWELDLTAEQLLEHAAAVGSDVPFCLVGGTMLAEGRGEHLTPVHKIESGPERKDLIAELKILLITPPIPVSTAWVYNQIPKTYQKDPIMFRTQSIAGLLHNDLEQFTFPQYPEVATLKAELVEQGATSSLMSGSGSSVFGLFETDEALEKAYVFFKTRFMNTYKVHPVTCGVELRNKKQETGNE